MSGRGVWGVALVLALAGSASGQEAVIQGIVRSAETGGPLEGVSVMLEVGDEQPYGTLTDRNGFYRLARIPEGAYTMRAQRIGYREYEQEITLDAGEQRIITFQLEESAISVGGVVVSPDRGAAVQDLGRQIVTSVDVQAVPVPAGTGDLVAYLQVLPGVVTTGDRGGQLFVRGGTPTENMILVDGVPVYKPFHILGFFSIFPEDLVSSADFYAGGFGARYSGRTSSVLDVRLRDGTPDRFRASGSVSPFLAEAVVEGADAPVAGARWLFAARRSLIEETSETLTGSTQPLTFESQLLKVTSSDEDDIRCSGLALHTADRGRLDPDDPVSHVSWDNQAAGVRCSGIWPNGQLIETNFGYSGTSSEAVTRGASRLSSNIWRMYVDGHTKTTFLSLSWDAGFEGYLESFDYDMAELFNAQADKAWLVGGSAYAEALIPVGDRIEIRPGVVGVAAPNVGVEPRLRAKWEPWGRPSEVVQGAVGLYRQHVIGAGDMRDVSSVFVAWLEPEDPLEAVHARLGWQQTYESGFRWSLEGYYNRMWHVPVPVWESLARYTTTLGQADGNSYGADVRVEYTTPGVYAFVGYGYGVTTYEASQSQFASWFGDPVQSYHPPHDRRHQVNAVLTFDVAGFDVSGRWQFGSGLPFTRPIGFDEAIRFTTALYDVRSVLGASRLVLDRPFTGRLPTTHRLDVSVERAFDVGDRQLAVQAGVVNAYDRRNMFYYDLYTGRRLDQLPLVPYAAVTLKNR